MVKRLSCILLLTVLCSCTSPYILHQRSFVTKKSLEQVGTPYHYGGYTPKMGFDCSGLVYYVYHHLLGYQIPRTVRALDKVAAKVWFFKHEGDLLFFNIGYKWWNPHTWHKVDHVGIYIGHGAMIHAPHTGSRVKIVYDVFHNSYWMGHYRYTKRLIH